VDQVNHAIAPWRPVLELSRRYEKNNAGSEQIVQMPVSWTVGTPASTKLGVSDRLEVQVRAGAEAGKALVQLGADLVAARSRGRADRGRQLRVTDERAPSRRRR